MGWPEMSAEAELHAGPAAADRAEADITLSVIIATYNTRELLSDCLQSVYENPPGEPFEIIVVDDASVDGTSGMVRDCFPKVRLLVNDSNHHYAYSNNRALELARGQFVFLLNSDTVVLPHAFDIMLAFLKSHPEAGAVGCRLLNGDGTIQWSVKTLPNAGAALFGARSIISTIFPDNRVTRKHLLHIGRDMTTPFDVGKGYVSSAAVMMPRKAIDAAGLLDKRLAYHVDADLCKRIIDAGYRCYYLPEAVIIHLDHEGGTTATLRARFRSLTMFEVHSFLYYRKHIQRSVYSPMQIGVALGLFAHFLVLVSAQVWRESAAAVRSMLRPSNGASVRSQLRPSNGAPLKREDGWAEAGITLSVIIATYNTRDLLADCLRSIYQSPPSETFEIIVVDDASVDGTSGMVRDCFPRVRLLVNESNLNYARSNNKGLELARGQFVFLLNSDTIVLPQAFDKMLAFLRAHPEAGAVGCRLLNEDGTIQWSVKTLPNAGAALFGARSIISRIFPNNRHTRKHLLQIGRDVTTPFDVGEGYVSGAAVMMPRTAIDAAGLLDTGFAFYHVDADHCKRIIDAGYRCYYLPEAVIIHLEHKGGSTANLRARFRSLWMFEVLSFNYYRKHLRRSAWSPMQIVVALGLFAHFLVLVSAQAWSESAVALRSLLRPRAAPR
jgi:N-acetylglucosaminyl-diphospho-decaprenol L-rhamnosyltransferase